MQIVVHTRTIGIKATAITGQIIIEILLFRDEINDIEAKTIDTFIGPEMQYLFDFGADFRILPIQIGLLFTEQVQVILVTA